MNSEPAVCILYTLLIVNSLILRSSPMPAILARATGKLRSALFILITVTTSAALATASATMRLDFFHTGSTSQELFSVDRIVIEPLPWPGNPSRPIDSTNRGTYFFEVRDLASQRLLYSRGFSSIFGEAITTDAAKKVNRTFHESLPCPARERPIHT